MTRASTLLVAGVADARASADAAAVLAAAVADADRAPLLVEVGRARPRRPTLLASADAKQLEERLGEEAPDCAAAARGRLCVAATSPAEEGLELTRRVTGIARAQGRDCIVHVPPSLLLPAAEEPSVGATGALLRADLPAKRALISLVIRSLADRRLRARVVKRPPGRGLALRAFAGLPLPGGIEAEGRRTLRRLSGGQGGQALPLVLGAAFVLLVAALAAVAIAGALTGKGRVQRGADLIALSAARSLRDDLPRLLSPAQRSDGTPNPAHLSKGEVLARARVAGMEIASANGIAPGRVRIVFPDRRAFAPLQARAEVLAELRVGEGAPDVTASATAAAAPPVSSQGTEGPAFGSGGGYSGPLVYRQSEGMRPDVAAAFDAMAAAASADGIGLVVVSGFRSDAEQAQLFAANPDPRWVAPPGQSLHRCATELDLGPSSAYSWLAGNAERFGFTQRYAWEAWHYGFTAGPAPCSAAGEVVQGAGEDGLGGAELGLPGFVPSRFRQPLLDAAARWGVSAALLAAQLMAESNFNPFAVSSAGAQGIAQFIPSTAAAYGLTDPFDATAAIGAQAHLMSDLMKQFGAPELALAAYNAGPAPVAECGCVPAYPETQAYVARIMALLGGAGALVAPALEVRLIE